MRKNHFVASVSVAATLGAAVASCWSFSDPNFGADAGIGGSGLGGTPGGLGNGGSSGDPVGGGGSGGPGSGGATGGGGSGGTSPDPGSGGATGRGGSGGSSGGAGGSGGSSGGVGGSGGSSGTGGATTTATGPCDILNAAGNTCVAAHSTVRALYGSYNGPLYQVCKGASAAGPNSCPGGNTKDIGVVAGGFADSASQDTFCNGATCTISIIYDQSPNGNHLKPSPAGGAKASADNPATATDLKTTLNGHTVYGVNIKTGMGYRAGCTGCGTATPKGTATGDQPETEYMITSQNGKQPGATEGCCFDYGNAETDSHDDGNGTMEAVYFGGGVVWGTGSPGGHANGPWVMADLENGLFAGWSTSTMDQNIPTNTPLRLNYITGILVGDVASQNGGKGRFALYGGDATAGSLTTLYDGIRPAKTGYVPMRKQGSIIMGTGGDNSASGTGQWFEGVMASGAATLATCNAVQANIVAARYGK
jgi:hypothetical protein